jgi:apolipoprotein N-acyltransferase
LRVLKERRYGKSNRLKTENSFAQGIYLDLNPGLLYLQYFDPFDYSMKQAVLSNASFLTTSIKTNYLIYLFVFLSGILSPLGFAPFHMPGMTLLGIAFLYFTLINHPKNKSFYLGFIFGLGYFGLGVSWVIVSIHDYGNLNYFLAGLATLAFIAYLSLFPALVAYVFKSLQLNHNKLVNIGLFSTLWCLSEIIRSTLFSGFPWLLIGTTQIDTHLKYLFPIIGIYGVGLFCSFASAALATAIRENTIKRYYYVSIFILIIITPSVFKNAQWTVVNPKPISIGVVQANLSMRDKWDEQLFWDLLKYYEKSIDKLLGNELIILPESAIPLPASYLEDYLLRLNNKAAAAKSALILGIMQSTNDNETNYYNSIISLGQASGIHIKHQLVPFGEYIPKPFVSINRWLNLPEPNILPGKKEQPLIKIANHSIASLICYEIAYPNLLRLQMPLGEWIVSISDNGWFGRSLASYQQLQMAQVLSLLTGRFHVVVNNDGLSSVINTQGDVVNGLPPFSAGILKSSVHSAEGATPWILCGDSPSLLFCAIFLIFVIFIKLRYIRYQ